MSILTQCWTPHAPIMTYQAKYVYGWNHACASWLDTSPFLQKICVWNYNIGQKSMARENTDPTSKILIWLTDLVAN